MRLVCYQSPGINIPRPRNKNIQRSNMMVETGEKAEYRWTHLSDDPEAH